MAKYIESLMLNGVQYYIDTEGVSPIDTPGIYHNSDLGLISLSSDGTTRITIADKNLGATQVYNSGDTLSEANCGKYYQWGNNYGFPRTGSVTTSSSTVSAAGYGPGNYYNSSTFILVSSSAGYTWDVSHNKNLWGGVTGTNEAMQGPCNTGFHVPTKTELENLVSAGTSLGAWTSSTPNNACMYLKLPKAGLRVRNTSNVANQGSGGYYLSSIRGPSNGYNYSMIITASVIYVQSQGIGVGASIRPFKNDAVQPDDSRTKLY